MPKLLKPYTIIPPDLYIKRGADRQIKNIITDMGRPGYVLVSRQMGKTNLLLNAKRELQNESDVFVYVDLSTPFDSARSCFENIIDIAVETNGDKFSEVYKSILERRKEYVDTPPHKQHVNELRQLLKYIAGKLVIILDEIDALTKTNYSDQIFSQIRSIYFTRANFAELNRLTYILSGVIEPTEIIKDPKISPFNIGQKIFLNDFSKEEFDNFLLAAKIAIKSDIRDRIFFWTNGNPRMTWDVCSEVENRIKEVEEDIDISEIDKIVQNIYLTTFDKPPVDNIREIVVSDREIRNAIVEIEFKKGSEIPQRIKNKLYLSGIINYEENTVRIKNEVIRQSLNLEWIQTIEEDEKGLVKIAVELFEKENFSEALNTFERFLDSNDFDLADKSLCYYYMGYAAYRDNDFKKSLKYLNQSIFEKEEEPKWFYRLLNLKGLANYYDNNIDESLKSFKTVIASGKRDENYARALINFGSISLKSDKESYKEEAIKIFNDIVNEQGFDKAKLTGKFVNELKSIALYNLGQINVSSNNEQSAIIHFRDAISFAKDNTKPTIILKLVAITKDAEEKKMLLQSLVHLILDGRLLPVEEDPEKPIEFSFNNFRDLVSLLYLHYTETLFEELIPKLSLLGNKTLSQYVFDLALFQVNINRSWDNGIAILDKLYQNKANTSYNIDSETLYKTTKLLAYFSDSMTEPEKSIEYLALFQEQRFESIDFVDLQIFANLIFLLIQEKQYDKALHYIHLIESLKHSVNESHYINYLVIYNLELQIYLNQKNSRQSIAVAKKILTLAENDNVKNQKSNLLGETGYDIIKKNAEVIAFPNSKQQVPLRVAKKFGRNEIIKVRYKDGSILEVKFKKVENDISNGECVILN